MQKLMPDEYAELQLPDQWVEDIMQEQAEVPWILNQIKDDKTILELGYGAGIVTRAMVQAGKEVTMVDGSQDFCNRAEKDGAMSVCTMFEDMKFVGKFDCVIASFVLEHILDPAIVLMKLRKITNKLIVVIGNANSWHRRLAVEMGIQPDIYMLSNRDHLVGHYRVYDIETCSVELLRTGWKTVTDIHGFQFKPLPNSMLAKLPREVIEAMCTVSIEPKDAANVGMVWK